MSSKVAKNASNIIRRLGSSNAKKHETTETERSFVLSLDIDGTLLVGGQINPTFFALLQHCQRNKIPVYLTTSRGYLSAFRNLTQEWVFDTSANGVYGCTIDYLVNYLKIQFDLDVTVVTDASSKHDINSDGSFYENYHKPFETEITNYANSSKDYATFKAHTNTLMSTIGSRFGYAANSLNSIKRLQKNHSLAYVQSRHPGATIVHVDDDKHVFAAFKKATLRNVSVMRYDREDHKFIRKLAVKFAIEKLELQFEEGIAETYELAKTFLTQLNEFVTAATKSIVLTRPEKRYLLGVHINQQSLFGLNFHAHSMIEKNLLLSPKQIECWSDEFNAYINRFLTQLDPSRQTDILNVLKQLLEDEDQLQVKFDVPNSENTILSLN